ncbi:MAG: WYL domain-containing protein, partial [Treponema sp.]|nr:WYL domain-containing protein [Treponema sp.]
REERSAAANRVIFLGAPASDVRDSIWSEIYKAMEGNYHIGIKYVSSGKSQQVSRGVRPYQLIFDDGIWDLWGYDCVKKTTRLFNLSRIKSVEIKKYADRFTLPKDYDFHNVTPGTFGCFRDADTDKMTHYKILLAKGSYAESFASERVWGLNPSVKTTKDGTIISFDDNQYLPILRWILGWGPDAEPLEPARLVKDWKARIKAMAELAGK